MFQRDHFVMKRRKLLSLASFGAASLLAGCSSNEGRTGDSRSPHTPTRTQSPTRSPEPAYISEVKVHEIPNIGELNTLGFQVTLTNLKSGSDYKVRVSVSSDGGTKTTMFHVERKWGLQAPMTGGKIVPVENTSTETSTLSYQAVLIEDGTEVDSEDDDFEYE